jgi:UDP-N-acetylglucosamine diphosphorylase/glucosamine-1-phosphate N-acetyltransferase
LNNLTAVILAAGEGVRMHPLTYTRPKVMLPIANRPILEHLLIEMQKAGVRDFIFIVGYHDEQIRGYFGSGQKWRANIEYRNQRKQLGTADALRMAEGSVTGDLLLANGDSIVSSADIANLIGRGGNVLSVIERQDVRGLGVIEAADGRVVRIHEKSEKPPSHLANAGLYLFTPDIFSAIEKTVRSPRGEFEITDSIQLMINSGKPVTYMEISRWFDFSYPWDLLAANESRLAEITQPERGEIEENVVLRGMVSVGKNTVVRSGSYIVGLVIIGEGCEIGPNCYIRPSSAIGDRCHIGASVEVKNSIIMSGSKVPHLNYVGDSIIGENCNLGAGTKIANLRIDKRNVIAAGIDTKRRKLGAIIGDEVETGINASINVGTLIGNNSLIGPGALARGVISPGSKIF